MGKQGDFKLVYAMVLLITTKKKAGFARLTITIMNIFLPGISCLVVADWIWWMLPY